MAPAVLRRIADAGADRATDVAAVADRRGSRRESAPRSASEGATPTTLTVAHENFLHLVTTEHPAEAERVQRRAFAAVMGDGRPFEYFQQVYLTGTLSEVLAKIDERIRVGVEYLMLHTLEPSPRQLDLWAEHVLPRLMDRGAPRDARPDVPG